jgi:tetratricopeptide (TPR) repeat protein
MVATGELDLHSEPAKAATTFREALKLYESVTQGHRNAPKVALSTVLCRIDLGTALFLSGRLPDAERQLTTALGEIERIPADPSNEATIRQARCLGRQKLAIIMAQGQNVPRAIVLLEDNIREDSHDAPSLTLLAMLHLDRGELTRAMDELNRAIGLTNGGDAEMWFLMSIACFRDGDRTKARAWYDKAARWMEANAPRDPRLIQLRTAVIESAK